jgi:small subunit ribosomal protein S1
VDNPRDVLKVGDKVDVYVLDVDRDRKRIALSLKKLQPDPWTLVDDHYTPGQLIEGRVTRVLDFGAFIELDLGVEGLLHVSEMIGTPELSPSDIVRAGEKLLVKIIRIDSRRKRLALSAKQVRRSEWERWVAEQQAALEDEEEEVEGPDDLVDAEVAEESFSAPEDEVVSAEAVEPDPSVADSVLEAEADDVAEEPGEAPEVEAAIAGTGAEEAATAGAELEASVDEVAEEPGEAPEVETAIAETGAEEAATVDAELEAGVDEVTEESGEAVEAETAIAETETKEVATAISESVPALVPDIETDA